MNFAKSDTDALKEKFQIVQRYLRKYRDWSTEEVLLLQKGLVEALRRGGDELESARDFYDAMLLELVACYGNEFIRG